MTQWIENPDGGRDRGPAGIARAWLEVLIRPQRFFRVGVAPGDQAPGLTFLLTVVFVAETSRYVLVADAYPSLSVSPVLEAVFWLSVVVLLVAPLGLHLVSALQTLFLVVAVEQRAGISETVQVIAYASAPCVVAGIPVAPLQAVAACYGGVLLVIGLRIVHDTSLARAAIAGFVPAVLVFGYGFGGLDALATVIAPLLT